MTDIRAAAAGLELGLGGTREDPDDPLVNDPDREGAGGGRTRGDGRESLAAAIGRPLGADDTPGGDADHDQPRDWKGDPD